MSVRREFHDMHDFQRLKSQATWDYSLMNYIESRGSIELAVAFADLFWPDFEVRHGCVLRVTGLKTEDVSRWIDATNGDRERVERALNLIHVAELVPSDPSGSLEMFKFLATTIAQAWKARLQVLFPERDFVVRAEMDDPAGPTVVCFQKGA